MRTGSERSVTHNHIRLLNLQDLACMDFDPSKLFIKTQLLKHRGIFKQGNKNLLTLYSEKEIESLSGSSREASGEIETSGLLLHFRTTPMMKW